jgi:hypothetical protein
MATKLNTAAEAHAKALISAGKVDKDAGWGISAEEENAILGNNDWAAYASWHLGEDPADTEDTKARYKYPFGKGGVVHRAALIAIRSRAATQGATSVFEAAGRLISQIDGVKATRETFADGGVKRMEVFAVGKWNGLTFTLADLQDIAHAFNVLGDNHRVPLKLGHNDEQPMTDGHPALGWVTDLSVEGDKLIADVSDIPSVVMSAMDKKLYRNVSVELDFNVKYKNQEFPLVLSGIALLGADIPAVNTLKDLTHYLGRSAEFSAGSRAVFSAIAGEVRGENEMDLKELQDKIVALTADNATLKAEIETFKAAAKLAETAAKAEKIKAKRAEVTQVLEDGVATEAITPAVREKYSKLLKVDNDEAVMALDVAEVRDLVGKGRKELTRTQGKEDAQHAADDSRPADVVVAEKVQEIIDKKEAPDFMTAQAILFRRDPKLARRYITMEEN